jgi:predicted O-methyltransferase YrrM
MLQGLRRMLVDPVFHRQRTSVKQRFAPGHYYSPVPDPTRLAAEPYRSRIWPATPPPTAGIDWRDKEQLHLCGEVFARQARLSFSAAETSNPRQYFASNSQFPLLDALILEAMLRYSKPRRMIEVGSGFSSLVTARVNREFHNEHMHFTCIEPYPREFLIEGVPGITDLRIEEVQDTPLEVFQELGKGDILFIDTSHTVKTGGDVPWIYNRILPALPSGVTVHIHDVFLPGDYPMEWVFEGWGWNELYLLQAFLAFNSAFEIVFGAQWMLQHHFEAMLNAFPDLRDERCRARSGTALWIRRR